MCSCGNQTWAHWEVFCVANINWEHHPRSYVWLVMPTINLEPLLCARPPPHNYFSKTPKPPLVGLHRTSALEQLIVKGFFKEQGPKMHKSNRDTFETLKSSLLICVVIWRKVGKQDKKWIAARMGRELAIGFTSWGFPLVRSSNNDSLNSWVEKIEAASNFGQSLNLSWTCLLIWWSLPGTHIYLLNTANFLLTYLGLTLHWFKKNIPIRHFLWRVSLLIFKVLSFSFTPSQYLFCAQVEALIFQMIQSLPIVGGEKIFLKKARTCFWRIINDHPILKIHFNQENSKYTKSMSWPSEYLPWRGSFSVARPY